METQPMTSPNEPYARIKVALLKLIQQNVENGIDKLPPEDELSRQLGVSRM